MDLQYALNYNHTSATLVWFTQLVKLNYIVTQHITWLFYHLFDSLLQPGISRMCWDCGSQDYQLPTDVNPEAARLLKYISSLCQADICVWCLCVRGKQMKCALLQCDLNPMIYIFVNQSIKTLHLNMQIGRYHFFPFLTNIQNYGHSNAG